MLHTTVVHCTYLFLFNFVLLLYSSHDLGHVRLQHHSTHHQLVQDKVDLQYNTIGFFSQIGCGICGCNIDSFSRRSKPMNNEVISVSSFSGLRLRVPGLHLCMPGLSLSHNSGKSKIYFFLTDFFCRFGCRVCNLNMIFFSKP